jgi:hypothetical protein
MLTLEVAVWSGVLGIELALEPVGGGAAEALPEDVGVDPSEIGPCQIVAAVVEDSEQDGEQAAVGVGAEAPLL